MTFVVPCTCSGTAFHVFKIVRYCYFSNLEEGFEQNNRFGKKTTIFLFSLHKLPAILEFLFKISLHLVSH